MVCLCNSPDFTSWLGSCLEAECDVRIRPPIALLPFMSEALTNHRGRRKLASYSHPLPLGLSLLFESQLDGSPRQSSPAKLSQTSELDAATQYIKGICASAASASSAGSSYSFPSLTGSEALPSASGTYANPLNATNTASPTASATLRRLQALWQLLRTRGLPR